jgi:Skp family chaperone for outer membrane proteins
MDTNDKEQQKRDHESNNNGLGKIENNKHPGPEREQHTVRNKLKEDFCIMWHKVKLLQMSERERLPNLKENSELIKLMEEINGIIKELLEEDESDITDTLDTCCSHNYDTKNEST